MVKYAGKCFFDNEGTYNDLSYFI